LVGTRSKTCFGGQLYLKIARIFQIQLPTKTSFTASVNQSNVSVTPARVRSQHGSLRLTREKKMIFTNVEIDFHHHGN